MSEQKLRYIQQILNNSGIQAKDPALYQVLNEILLLQEEGEERDRLIADPLQLILDAFQGLYLENTSQSGLAQFPFEMTSNGIITARRLCQTIFMGAGNAQNTGATPTNIIFFNTTPKLLCRNSDTIYGNVGGNLSNNTNAKTLVLSFDGSSLLSLSCRADGSSGTYFIQFWIQRANSTVMIGRVNAMYHNAAGVQTFINNQIISKPFLDFTINNYTISLTAQGVATGDINWQLPHLILEPSAFTGNP